MNLSFISYKLIVLSLLSLNVFSQEVLPLYPDGIPNSKPVADTESSAVNDGILIVSNVTKPSITNKTSWIISDHQRQGFIHHRAVQDICFDNTDRIFFRSFSSLSTSA